jgi:hypothetical protein
MSQTSRPGDEARFDWRIFADATCAGMSALIPIPLVDLLFEAFFRRRIAPTVARARGIDLDPHARRGLGRGRLDFLGGCLGLPFKLVRYVIKKLWRKVIYVFTVADAAGQISVYWHRAYLIDHIVRAGHASPGVDIERAIQVFGAVLEEADTSPVRGIARQVAGSARHAFRLLRKARRGAAAAQTRDQEELVRANWNAVQKSFDAVAARYNELYVAGLPDGSTPQRVLGSTPGAPS